MNEKVIYVPLYDSSCKEDSIPVRMLKISDIYYNTSYGEVFIISNVCDDEKGAFENWLYRISMSVEEYNQLMKILFDNNVVWVNKICAVNAAYEKHWKKIDKMNEKIQLSIIGSK